MGKLIDLTGKRFGKLTVLNRCDYNKDGYPMWHCKCDCGKEKDIKGAGLRNGSIKSCGCRQQSTFIENNPNYKHGESGTKLYKIWEGIKKRCYQKNCKSYKNYGGRGIIMCEEWLNDFLSFKDWAIKNGYEDNLTIDRKDVNDNYSPKNCRWIDIKRQANNRRSNRYIEYKGEKHTMAEWATILNIPYGRIQSRLDSGWTVEDTFNTPLLKANRKYGDNAYVK